MMQLELFTGTEFNVFHASVQKDFREGQDRCIGYEVCLECQYKAYVAHIWHVPNRDTVAIHPTVFILKNGDEIDEGNFFAPDKNEEEGIEAAFRRWLKRPVSNELKMLSVWKSRLVEEEVLSQVRP
jgi:hypothetical protein